MRPALRWAARTIHGSELVAVLLALLILMWPATPAQAEKGADGLERRVKAAFLYRFAGYVSWPESAFTKPDAPIVIGVINADTLAAELEELVAGRTVNGRSFAVKRIRFGDSLAGIHMLFIASQDPGRIAEVSAAAQPQAILTVSEADGALSHGAVINFVIHDARVQFEISLDAAEKAKLSLSSRLLAVAQHVRKGAI